MADPALLERDDELALVDEMLASAGAGEGRFLLIEGLAGIGKTRVLTEVRRRAGSRKRVLTARGSELEAAFPFGAARQLFEGVMADPELREIALAGAGAAAGDVLGAPTGNTQAGNASFAVLHGLYWLTLNLAEEQPLVLAVDDLQWVDRPSLRFLAYLVRRLEGAPVLLAATLRSSEPGIDPALLAEVVRDAAVESLQPRPLSEEAVGGLIEERLGVAGDEAFVAACHRSTGGNPAAPAPAAGRARGGRRQPGGGQRRHGPPDRPACGLADRAAAARPSARASRRRRPRRRDPRRARRARRRGGTRRARARGAGRDDRGAHQGRDPARRPADRLRAPAGPRRHLSGDPARRARVAARPRRRGPARRGRPRRAHRHPAAAHACAGDTLGGGDLDGRRLRGDLPRRTGRRGRVLPARAR
ncbi:MAG: AAA family ATPase [Baekduiaceae bacterium]